MRAVLVRLHRYAGLATALFLVVAGLTGSLIVFHPELDRWLNPDLHDRVSAPGPRLSAGALAAVVEAADPRAHVVFVSLADEPGRSVDLFVAPHGPERLGYNQVFADPGDGRILGRREYGACCFSRDRLMPFLHEFHYTLHLPGLWGVWLMGGIGLVWLVDSVIGLALTWPRARPWLAQWRPAWTVRRGAGAYRLNFDLHRAGGLWTWVLLIVLSLSSVALNLHDEIFEPVVEAVMPVTPHVLDRLAPPRPADHAEIGFDRAVAGAMAEAARRGWDWPPHSVFHADEAGVYGVNFGAPEEPGLGLRTLYVDDATGQPAGDLVPGAGTAGDLLMEAQFPLHSGRIAGLAGRIAIVVMGLAVAGLSVTGIVIWWR